MGRIKSILVKRTSEKLMEQQEFSDKFEDNKKILGNTMPSKKVRNTLAGYLTRLVRIHNAKQKLLTPQNSVGF